MRFITLLFLTLLPYSFLGQDSLDTEAGASYKKANRTYTAVRKVNEIILDGELNDIAWNDAEIATGFISLEPVPGLPAIQPTEVKIIYDDEAIYIGAFMHEVSKDSILRELTERDNIGNSDFFGIAFDTYKDNINGFEFVVTAAGTQFDARITTFGEDDNWNAVWFSKTALTDSGWVAEIKIPYSAIRFPKKEVQNWNLNMFREIRRARQQVFWNELDPKVDGFLTQSGNMHGVHNIDAPFRLAFIPYVAFGFQVNSGGGIEATNSYNYSGGMDLKYGINDAYTLDMTLIPDFSQAQSDNTVLNLTQFEVRYDENRQFFTEGIELFDKADLIYWRRVGGVPLLHYSVEDSLNEGDYLVDSPEITQLLNAFKISGRNAKGLGIGVFNAFTKPMYAKINNDETGSREILTDPFTNYNSLVVDKNLKNNSYLSFINTNVTRAGDYYNANVLGTQFKFLEKTNTYGVQGSGSWSKKYGTSVLDVDFRDGFTYEVAAGKVSGNLTYYIENEIVSDTYDRNDFGFLRFNNIISTEVGVSYNIYEAFGRYNRGGFGFNLDHLAIYNTGKFADFGFGLDGFLITKKFNAYGAHFWFEPIKNHDYWETRVEGRYYLEPENFRISGWYSTDYNKKFAFDINGSFRLFNSDERRVDIRFSPRYRASDKLAFVLNLFSYNNLNEIGFAEIINDDDIILGKRDRNTFETRLNIKYTFTHNMGLNFRLRHYWSTAVYKNYYSLNPDGTLGDTDYNPINDEGQDYNNVNFNAFNIDMIYTWVFLPGSELSFIWKNIIQDNQIDVEGNYFENLTHTLQLDQINTFTIKALYYLDYLWLKKLKKNSGEHFEPTEF